MLAKLGEGPHGHGSKSSVGMVDSVEIDCEQQQEPCSDSRTVNMTLVEATDPVAENLCWGYEKECTKKNRLFVPHCHEPPQPWYVHVYYMQW